MLYTQVELTSPSGEKEVWWLPVPSNRAGMNEVISRDSSDLGHNENWVVTAVCTTLKEESIPNGSRIAKNFKRSSQTLSYMSI